MSLKTYQVWSQGKASQPMTGASVRGMLDAGQLHEATPMMVTGDSDWLSVKDFLEELPSKGGAVRTEANRPSSIAVSPERIIEPLFATKTAGFVLLILGFLAIFFFFFNFNTAIQWGGRTINNIGLLNDRQCGIMVGGFFMVTGAIFIAAGSRYRIR